jgi:hypothetical protein
VPQGLRVFDASGVEQIGVTTSLCRILSDVTATYTNGSSTYSGTVTHDGLKVGTAWCYIAAVRYKEDEAGDETDLSSMTYTVNRTTGVLSWTAVGFVGVTTLEIRVVVGVR